MPIAESGVASTRSDAHEKRGEQGDRMVIGTGQKIDFGRKDFQMILSSKILKLIFNE